MGSPGRSLAASLLVIGTAFQLIFGPTHTAGASFNAEYTGIGPPLFPNEPGATLTCYQYFLALAEANCTIHESTTLPVRVHNCANTDGASGLLVLERTLDTADAVGVGSGTAVYRLRVAGPDGLWLLEPTYCRPDFAMAMYDLRLPGLFSVEVLMLYTSFSFVQPNSSRAVQAPWAGYLTLDVRPISSLTSDGGDSPQPSTVGVRLARERWTASPDESVLTNGDPVELLRSDNNAGERGAKGLHLSQQQHLRSRHPPLDGDAGLPLCADAGPLPGRWHFAEWPPAAATTAVAAATLLRTCIWFTSAQPDADCGGPERRPLRYDSHPAALSWRPYGCRLRAFAGIPPPPPAGGALAAAPPPAAELRPPPPPVTAARCLPPGRRVCFVGDSHTRYLQNSLVLWQRGFRATVNNTVKELLASDSVHYEYMRWGHDWPEATTEGGGGAAAAIDALTAANCTDVVANFGQWPASYRSGSAPYSAVSYMRHLLRMRRTLLAARRARGVRVFWVTTVMSSLKARLESAGVDWRTDPLLMLYNRLSYDVMSGQLTLELAGMRSTAVMAAAAATGAEGAEDGEGEGGGKAAAEEPRRQRRQATTQAARQQQQQQKRRAEGITGEARNSSSSSNLEGAEVPERQQRRRTRRRSRPMPQPGGPPVRSQSLSRRRNAAADADATSPSLSQQLLGWLQRALLPGPATSSRQGGRRPGRLLLQAEAEAEAGAANLKAEEEEAIPVIDTWSATRILHDATWDGVHYANTGAVGLTQLGVLLHALCAEGGGEGGGER